MDLMRQLITKLESSWGKSATAIHRGKQTPFKLKCLFLAKGKDNDILNALGQVPSDYKSFLLISNGALLFVDDEYGQWGLELFPADTIRKETNLYESERSECKRKGDLIIGRFMGDSDLLLLRCDANSDDFGHVIIVNAIDPREYWSDVANGFYSFMQQLSEAQGNKYWEICT